MAVSLTRNLKLRINSNLTADAKYNLERIDLIGGNFLASTSDALLIRSRTNVVIEPESPDIDGSGTGGTVSIGTADHAVDTFNIFASAINLSSTIGFLDQGAGGTKYLRLKYKSDLSGSTDLVADRSLFIDLQGADREFILGGNVSLPGGLSVSTGSLTLTQSGNTTLTLPSSGTLSTLAGTESFSNKTFTDRLRLGGVSYTTDIQPADSGQTESLVFKLPADYGESGQVLRTNGAGALTWVTVAGTGASQFEATWLAADGTTKVITHNLGSTDVDTTVIDLDTGEEIGVGSIIVTNANILTLMASEAPANSWRVVIQAN